MTRLEAELVVRSAVGPVQEETQPFETARPPASVGRRCPSDVVERSERGREGGGRADGTRGLAPTGVFGGAAAAIVLSELIPGTAIWWTEGDAASGAVVFVFVTVSLALFVSLIRPGTRLVTENRP